MLRITADIFSGRSNPVWEVRDGAEARAALRALTADRGLLTESAPAASGLGFRGFQVETLGDDHASDLGLASVYLPVGALAGGAGAAELGERLISLIGRSESAGYAAEDALPLDESLATFLGSQLEAVSSAAGTASRSIRDTRSGEATAAPGQEQSPADAESAAAVVCYIERTAFNPGFWNNDATTLRNNNCYNYASNWRTNTFAQPGRGAGAMYTAVTCAEVTRGALADGMHRRFDCFPDTEKPRPLTALVVAPGPGFIDYHWYRLQSEPFWGHKPGGTAARNTDNSGVVISNPETANRGAYTQFCGYFYGCNTQRNRIR
ncbi:MULTISPECIES: hypothetical protein [unclassified Crossiella]|uniref:hypothetical protein n=1 Tax=unclassified Crossiella TaxID=2620835 RepID=UPI001FFF9077|nr:MULTISPECIES: hypothetical protein [unclassified Crossiella]MCK2240465.1 hypothetical protein [Crossiella sp. S99.2]MCK2253084.1 hypothetical protein [Crossiella sp. S99.1]